MRGKERELLQGEKGPDRKLLLKCTSLMAYVASGYRY